MAVTVEEVTPEENYTGPPIFRAVSDKFKVTYTISKSVDGYAFFHITVDKGQLPKALRSRYSSHQQAKDALIQWERTQEKSKTVQRDNRAAAREAEKKAALNAD